MMNTFAKFLLVATSLSPVLGAVAVNQFARDESWCCRRPKTDPLLRLVPTQN